MPDIRTTGVQPEVLATLTTQEFRRLCSVVAIEHGLSIVTAVPRGDHEDLILKRRIFLTTREVLMRILFVPAETRHLDELQKDAGRGGYADYLLVAPQVVDQALLENDHTLDTVRLARLLSSSALVVPNTVGAPDVDRRGYRLVAQLADATVQDRLGLLWLPILAKNRLPIELSEAGTPEDLFEKFFFRLATTVFDFQGERFGTAKRGKRVGDAILVNHDASVVILADCKAAAAGYVMDVDDERRLVEYARNPQPYQGQAMKVRYVLVISSSFPGTDGHRHPFYTRRSRFHDVGSDLAYLRVEDFLAAALHLLEIAPDNTHTARQIDWAFALKDGIVGQESLIKAVDDAARAKETLEGGTA
ncbi:hypothetical protein [Nonomuraea sp. NPDC049784]|uniref:hypothetical protein n=1 Tax=Nonomuraea sp. NPDC049784 TaxID=3154361 RepID=UPI0033F2433D